MIVAKIENFTENELKCRCGCGRFNIDNEFLIRLQAFRYIIGRPLRVTSGCRCKKHNKNEGGVDNSCHQCETKKCTACDITCQNLDDVYNRACRSGLFNEVIYYRNKMIIHLGLDRNQKGNFFEVK